MANRYVRSGGDAGAWTGTYTSVALAAAADAAGDSIYVASDHAESLAAAQSWAFAGTNASPVWVIGSTTAAAPPTVVSTAPTCATTGGNSFTITGNCYVYGLTINAGTGVSNASIIFASTASPNVLMQFEDCNFKIVAPGSAGAIAIGAAANEYPSRITWKDCHLSFAAASQRINHLLGEFVWDGGSILSGSTALTGGLITSYSAGEYAKARISGVDLQHLGSASYLTAASASGTLDVVYRNCRLPASWTGGVVTGTLNARDRVEVYNCDSADTNYALHIEDYAGVVTQETVIVRTGGASNGTTTISHKFVTSANAEYPHITLAGPEMVRWNETTGSAITVAVEIVTDNVTLTDAEAWLDVQYLGTSGVPLGSFVNDAKADVLATAANQATSTETWTTTGLTTPVKQKLAVTFTPQEKGFIHAVVRIAKASTTVYIDPELTVT